MKTCFTQEKFNLIDETKDQLDLMSHDLKNVLMKTERMADMDEI